MSQFSARYSQQLEWLAEDIHAEALRLKTENPVLSKALHGCADSIKRVGSELRPPGAPMHVHVGVTDSLGQPVLKDGSEVYVAVINNSNPKDLPSVQLVSRNGDSYEGGGIKLEAHEDGFVTFDGRNFKCLGVATFHSLAEYQDWIKRKFKK